MRAVIQRVESASVSVEGEIRGQIGAGFLVLIGVEEDRLEEALDVLQKYAGHRKETVYQSVTMPHGEMSAVPPVPMEVMAGGAAVFIVSLDDIRKF